MDCCFYRALSTFCPDDLHTPRARETRERQTFTCIVVSLDARASERRTQKHLNSRAPRLRLARVFSVASIYAFTCDCLTFCRVLCTFRCGLDNTRLLTHVGCTHTHTHTKSVSTYIHIARTRIYIDWSRGSHGISLSCDLRHDARCASKTKKKKGENEFLVSSFDLFT